MSMILTAQAMKLKIGNPARKLVLLKLADNANDEGVCFPSYQNIADHCEISKRSAISHIDALIEMGLVSKKERKTANGNTSNLYFLHLERGEKNTSGGEKSALGGVNDFHYPSETVSLPPSENISPRINHSFNQSINHKKTTQKKTALDSELEECFERFWQAGMRKAKKSQSLLKFQSAYQRWRKENPDKPNSLDDFTCLLVGDIRRRIELAQFGFSELHPTTYLHNQRWKDDLPKSQATKPEPITNFKNTHYGETQIPDWAKDAFNE